MLTLHKCRLNFGNNKQLTKQKQTLHLLFLFTFWKHALKSKLFVLCEKSEKKNVNKGHTTQNIVPLLTKILSKNYKNNKQKHWPSNFFFPKQSVNLKKKLQNLTIVVRQLSDLTFRVWKLTLTFDSRTESSVTSATQPVRDWSGRVTDSFSWKSFAAHSSFRVYLLLGQWIPWRDCTRDPVTKSRESVFVQLEQQHRGVPRASSSERRRAAHANAQLGGTSAPSALLDK